jgi:hypothetical protein
MARPKSWLVRLPLIVENLEASAIESFSRPEIERLFQISRSQATQLMSVAGAVRPGPGVDATLSRENLLFYLRHSPEGQDAMVEVARRKRLGATIKQADKDLIFHTVQIPCTEADEWAGFDDLPNLSLTPGVLTVVFSDPLDLMGQLYRFAKAAGADWEAFLQMYERMVKEVERKAS